MRHMLHVDPQRRFTATQVLNHPWICQRGNLPISRLEYHTDALSVKVRGLLFDCFSNVCSSVFFLFLGSNDGDVQRDQRRCQSASVGAGQLFTFGAAETNATEKLDGSLTDSEGSV